MLLISRDRKLESQNPVIMGVINVTPDSFYAPSRFPDVLHALEQAAAMLEEGAGMLDIGAMSTRPGAKEISMQEEVDRLMPALSAIRKEFPQAFLSVDTYRARVATEAVKAGADMINDISGGVFDPEMFPVAGRLNVPYVLMHTGGKPESMQKDPFYSDVLEDVREFFSTKLEILQKYGTNQIILDPGFGFGKTIEHNYRLLAGLHVFSDLGHPVMVGVSRKSMINKVLHTTPPEALNGTTVLNTIALLNGASILRVHDVKEAVECRRLVSVYHDYGMAEMKTQ